MKRDYFNPPSARIGDVVPTELKLQKLWLLWREEPDEGKEKPKKVAHCANGRKRYGKQGKPEDVANLVTFDAALAAYNAAQDYYAGLGIALLQGMGIGALDLDDCIDASGKPVSDLDVRRILRACPDCYIERSPSGGGLRVIGSTEEFPQITATGFEGVFPRPVCDRDRGNGAERRGMGICGRGCRCHVRCGAAQDGGCGIPAKNAGAKGVNLSTHGSDPETLENVERVRGALMVLESGPALMM